MKNKPPKRSLSPFALRDPEPGPAQELEKTLAAAFGAAEGEGAEPSDWHALEDIRHLPAALAVLSEAPANDAPSLDTVCQFILRTRESLDQKGVLEPILASMTDLFWNKTDLFMVDHWDREHCEKTGLPDPYRDNILFARERDALVGRFFAPIHEAHPGRLSEFVSRWTETDNPDRILHFLDFCSGSKNPTFEHYLLFSHPALARVVSSKAQLRALFERAQPVLGKLKSPTWETNVRTALGV